MDHDEFHKQHTIPPGGYKEFTIPDELPSKIGPYPIQSLLEKGSMSVLYLGTHPETHEPIIIKVLPTPLLSRTDHVQRFLNEAEIIAMANHPNIVKLYGYGEWEGGLYIAMEFIEGISLKQYLMQHPVSLKRALEIVLDISYALCHLHTHGVIHRDLKPDNILITGTGLIKVIDFGIAQLMSDKPADPSSQNRLIGTPIYMSPEQTENPDNVSYPSDIYSLGIISYELVLGKLSHGHIHVGLMPKGLQKIINKALQRKVEERYTDIVDFLSDITAYLQSNTVEKEKKATDQVSELYENFQIAQRELMNVTPPKWDEIETVIVPHFGLGISPFINDFIILSSQMQGYVIGEATAQGAKGVLHSAAIRGIIRSQAVLEGNPETFLHKINTVLIDDPINPSAALATLFVYPETNRFVFYSCGYGQLWLIREGLNLPEKISSTGIALGLEKEILLQGIEGVLQPGDLLVVSPVNHLKHSVNDEFIVNDEFFLQIWSELIEQPIAKKLEGILRRIKALDPVGIEEQSFILTAFTSSMTKDQKR